MGNSFSINKINFEKMQCIINNNNNDSIIINTMNHNLQKCLIYNTINVDKETDLLNNLINNNKHINIIIYGVNACDDSVIKKYNQLYALGFINLYIYCGGIFEWLLLQDIYGEEAFKTTTKEIDILKYKNCDEQLLLN
jgi:hypothetical protein